MATQSLVRAANGGQYYTNTDYTKLLEDAMGSGSTNYQSIKNNLGWYKNKTSDDAYKNYYNQSMVDRVNDYLGSISPSSSSSGGYSSSSYYDQMLQNLQQQRAQEEAALRARIEGAVSQNNAYIPQVNQAYADQQQQNYISREMQKSALPENMAALGLSGGASESALLGVNTNYENLRGKSDMYKNQALENIRQNEQNIRSTGDASLASLGGNYLAQQMSLMQAEQARQDALSQWQATFNADQNQRAWGNAFNQSQFDRGILESDRSYAMEKALNDYNLARPYYKMTSTSSSDANSNTKKDVPISTNQYSAVAQMVAQSIKYGDAQSALNAIQNNLKKGAITQTEAQDLLRKYGL